ncbi:MAG: FMN-binding protein [Planctomycetes bacterium]|nr:FMN-binding protein [Planctomycetota bacterium]
MPLKKVKYFIEQSWLLIISALFFGLLIAAVNASLAPQIERNKINKLDNLMKKLLPQAEKFKVAAELQIDLAKGKKTKSTIYKAISKNGECVGWSFNCSGAGFADKIELVVAVDKNFEKMAGFDCLSSNETPGFGDKIKEAKWRKQFDGAPAENLTLAKTGNIEKIDSEIIAISGATVSSDAVVNILNNAMSQIKKQMTKIQN